MGSTVIPINPGEPVGYRGSSGSSENESVVIKFDPETKLIDDPYFVAAFQKEILEVSKNAKRVVVLDFSNVVFLGASILGKLITFQKSGEKTLVLARLHDQPLGYINQTNLNRSFFNIEETIPESSNVHQFKGNFKTPELTTTPAYASYVPISRNRVGDLLEEGFPIRQGNEITFRFKETKFDEDCLKPQTLRDDILSMVESGITLVILDLENVSFIGEEDIGQLITLNKELYKREPKAKVIIENPQQGVFDSLKIKKLHRLFCPTENVS